MGSLFGLEGSCTSLQGSKGLTNIIGMIELNNDLSLGAKFYDEISGEPESTFRGKLGLEKGIFNLSFWALGEPIYLLGTGRNVALNYDLQKQNNGSVQGKYVGVRNLVPWKCHYDPDLGIPFWRPDMNGEIIQDSVELDIYK